MSCIPILAQFDEIPIGTEATLTDIVIHGDTLLLSGNPNYFAKYDLSTGEITEMPHIGIEGYNNIDLQIINNAYYIYSGQGAPYEHNFVLKSTNYGESWDTIFHSPGLFYTLSMADSTFGVLAGAYGSHAITSGSDDAWELKDSLFGVILSSDTYGDSSVILEGTEYSYISHNRGFSWDYSSGAFLNPSATKIFNHDTIVSISNYGGGGDDSYFSVTMDSGESWDHHSPCNLTLPGYDCFSTVYQVYLDSNGTGYILSYIEKIWHDFSGTIIGKAGILFTNDFGISWTSYITEYETELYDMVFVNDSVAYLCGENGLLLKWDLSIPLSNILSIDLDNKIITSKLNTYPNPISDDILLLSGITEERLIYEVYSLSGQMLKEGVTNDYQLDLSGIGNGQYILRVLCSNGTYTTKIFKQ